jgi:hypothetical protein
MMLNGNYTFYIEKSGWLERIVPGISAAREYNYDGLLKDEWISPELKIRFKAQTFTEIRILFNNENFKRREYRNLTRMQMVFNTDFSDVFQFGFFGRYGYFVGNRWDDVPVRAKGLETFDMWFSIKPLEQLIITPGFSFAEARNAKTDEELYRGYIARVKFNYQFTPEIALRLVAQYDDFSGDFSFEPLFSYRLNAFSSFYFGANTGLYDYGGYGWRAYGAQIFVKFRYLFNI